MKYKIVRKEYLYKEEVYERFYVMYESMAWWRKPKWKHCREFTYASYETQANASDALYERVTLPVNQT